MRCEQYEKERNDQGRIPFSADRRVMRILQPPQSTISGAISERIFAIGGAGGAIANSGEFAAG